MAHGDIGNRFYHIQAVGPMNDPIPEAQKMKKTYSIIPAVIVVFTLGACQEFNDKGSKEFLGTLGGAALGGYLGSKVGSGTGQLTATAGGALLGALVGGNIGRSLDEVDKMKAAQAHTQAQSAPIGETIAWNNPDTGHSGTVTAKRDGYDTNGDYCREFQQTITVGGKTEQAYGIACRQPDGSWRIIN